MRRHRPQIDASIPEDLPNALVPSTNTKARVRTRIAFGLHSAEALIALAMPSLGGYGPELPDREDRPQLRPEILTITTCVALSYASWA